MKKIRILLESLSDITFVVVSIAGAYVIFHEIVPFVATLKGLN